MATQNITDPALGPTILASLAASASAQTALDEALAQTPFAAYRQLLVIGPSGPPALHSGVEALGIVASAQGPHCAAGGNLLANAEIPRVMTAAFEQAPGHLGDRLLEALQAGARHGGEAGPVHSAGLLLVRDQSWPLVDLRVDWSETDPLAALAATWAVYAPQIDAYVQRALDPRAAPSFGVPGDP